MLGWIVLACLAGGVLSVVAAFVFVGGLSRRASSRLIAFAAGVMLASALLDVLPEAFHRHASIDDLFATLLAGLVGFYALERLALWRHAHPHVDGHDHGTASAAPLVLVGDAFHNFVDGVLIAAAFLADPWLGVTTTLAVIVHEVPQELGDFVLLLDAGWSRARALAANAASGAAAVIGGIVGFAALDGARDAVPYVLTIAAASFLYIAVADLLPLLHRQRRRDGFAMQSALLAAGIAIVPIAGHWLHH